MSFPPVEEQLLLIRRGVEKIVPEDELAEKLKRSRETGTPLRVKYGIDPTGVDLHLGHTVPIRKMRQFQQLGHQAVIIIGNYTAMVGDPSGRDETRARLNAEQVEANATDYLNQLRKVIDLDKAEVVPNGNWFSEMSFADLLELCSKVTVAQLLTRDDFATRYKNEVAIYLHECLYPVMQAWDSVQVRANIELGGTEQLYSFMLARDLQRDQNMPGQVGVMSPILVGIEGKLRMGKSLRNYIGISESPFEMMKKFMQVPDDVMQMYFELLTDRSPEEIERLLGPKTHPKAAKIELAKDIVSQYWGEKLAQDAAEDFERVFSRGELPSTIKRALVNRSELQWKEGRVWLPSLMVLARLAVSTSEARRLIQQKAVRLGKDRQLVTDPNTEVEPDGLWISVGKRKICEIGIRDR